MEILFFYTWQQCPNKQYMRYHAFLPGLVMFITQSILWPISAGAGGGQCSWNDSGEAATWMALPDWHLHYNCTRNSLKCVCGQPTSYAGLQLQPCMHGINLTGGVLRQSYFLKSKNGYINVIKCHCSMQWEVYLQATAFAGQLPQVTLGGMNTVKMNLGKLMTDMLRMTTSLPSWVFHTWNTSRGRKSIQWPWDTLSNVRNHVGTYMKDHYTVLEENHPHGHINFSGQHWTLKGHILLTDTPTNFSRVAELHKLNTDFGQAQQKMKVVNSGGAVLGKPFLGLQRTALSFSLHRKYPTGCRLTLCITCSMTANSP